MKETHFQSKAWTTLRTTFKIQYKSKIALGSLLLLGLVTLAFSSFSNNKSSNTTLALNCGSNISGTVFYDSNFDGANDPSDYGLSGVEVSAYNCENVFVDSDITDENGEYIIANTSIGETYRIELNIDNAESQSLKPGPSGTDNLSAIRYASPGNCVDFGLVDPDACTESLVAAVCFARNNDTNAEPTIVFVNTDDARDWPGPANNNDNNGLWGIPSGSNSGNYPLTFLEASNVGEVNTTFGMDFDVDNSRLITGSYMRAYSPMSANSSANGYAEAALYQIPMDLTGGAANTPSLWLDLEDLLSDGVAGDYLPDNNYPGPSVYGRTGSNPDLIGYTGLGSIKISQDRSELYVVNLNKRSVYVIPIGPNGEAPTSSSDIKEFLFPNTDCSGSWPDGRDLRAVLGLGVHPESGRVYATLTCTGPTYDDVTGYVYSFDPADTSPSSSDFDLELTLPLNIARPATSPNTGTFWAQIGKPWESVNPNTVFYLNDPRTGGNIFNPIPNEKNTQHNQPWLGEVEFGKNPDGTYAMVIGERNRYHDLISSSFYVAGGVIYRACGSEGNWSISSDNSCNSDVSSVNFSYTGSNAGVYTNSENRYMMYVGREGSMGSGMLTIPKGTPYVVSPVMDNLFNSATSGLTWLNFTDGGREKDIRILGNYSNGGFNNTNFTKANNWGAISSMCIPNTIEIGNYVWLDANGDGVQDACEVGIPNVIVELYTADGSTLLGTTTTNGTGEYYFNDDNVNQNGASGILADTEYVIKIPNATGSSQQAALDLLIVTDANATNDNIDSDGISMNDMVIIEIVTGGYGCSNHTYDVGFQEYISCLSTSEPISCAGANDGSITITASAVNGETLEYSINGTDYFNDNEFSNLAPGTYNINVRLADDNAVVVACGSIILADPPALTINTTEINISCGPINDGGVLIANVSNGQAPYLYDWSDDAYDGNSTAQNVPIGSYMLTITDDNGCTATANMEIIQEPCVPNPCMAGEIGGTVFVDNNADGEFQPVILESGLQGIKVELYQCTDNGTSELIEVVYTDPNGDYHFTTTYSGEDFKIIFPEIPTGYTYSSIGSDNGTDVIFVSGNGCNNNLALYDSETVCASPDLELSTAPGELFSDGKLLGPGIALITCGTITNLPAGDRHTVGLMDIRSINMAADRPENNPDSWWHPSWHVDEIGNVFGADYDHNHNMYVTPSSHYSNTFGYILGPNASNYAAAVIKYGDIAGGDANPLAGGTVYKLDAVTGQATIFTQLPQQAATFTHTGCETQADPPQTRTTGVGLGNIVFDRVNRQFFVSNFEDGAIYRIDTLGNILNSFDPQTLTGFAADDGVAGMAPDAKPYGLTVNHDGTVLYFGTHELNTTPGLYSVNLDTNGNFDGTEIYHRDFLAEGDIGFQYAVEPGWVAISDLDFLPDGRIMVGLKTGCAGSYFTSHNHGGTFYIASANDADGLYNDNIINPDIQYPNDATGNDDGYGGAGIWDMKDGTWNYLISSSDTRQEEGPHGLIMFPHDFTNGNSGFSLQPSASIPYIPSFNLSDFKGVGGDVKVTSPCGEAPIHVGNYVWIDENGDGIQDPCEAPISGVTVKLYEKPTSGSATLIATTITSATGNYYFTDSDSPSETWEAGYTAIEEGVDYAIVFCGDEYDDGNEIITINGEIYSMTTPNSSEAVNDQDDSDVEEVEIPGIGDLPAICFTAEETDFTFDAGIKLKCEMYIDEITLPVAGEAFEAIVDITWVNGPINGEFEYQFNNSGVWLPLNRNSQAASDSETLNIPLEVSSKQLSIRFEEDSECYIEVLFVFDLDDPAGFIYCERTGQILEGGSVDVTPPAGGTWLFVTRDGEVLDGSSGHYEWVVVGTPLIPGVYSMEVTPPNLMNLSMTTTPGNPAYGNGDTVLDPTRMGIDYSGSGDSIILGAYANADSTFLLDFAPASNPFFLDFDLEIDDPFILNNNIPIKDCYCDLALINTIDEIPDSPKVGDTIKYAVIIENQGDVDATNVEIKYTIPNGLDFVAVSEPGVPSWSDDGDCATTTITTTILEETNDTICIYLTLENLPVDEVTADSWTTFAEIASFEDPNDPGVDKEDFDSNPDSDPTNDPGGNPDDDTDDETGGDGSGDPEDPAEDTDPDLDEDDHDPAIIELCDAAAIVNTDDEGPFQYNDTVKFNIVVFNQGNGDITNVEINDFLGAGLDFISTPSNDAEGWSGDNDQVTATFTETIGLGDSDTLCLELQVVSVIPFDEDAYIQTIEISSFEDPEDLGTSKEDIDSTPDDDPDNDPGGNPDDETDDETDGEGDGDPEDENENSDPDKDEDDNDSDILEVFDLAITKTIVNNIPYAPGEMVSFDILVYNQGNVDATNYKLTDYLRTGFTFSSTGNSGWGMVGDNLEYTSSGTLAAGDTAMISLTLTVVIPDMPTGVSDWWNYVEISEVDDDGNPNTPAPEDADSTPDNDEENDNDIDPGEDDDGEITENGMDGEDEDDHDPEAVIVGYDLALQKTVSPEGTYSYGDTLTYTITVFNQGGLPVSNVEIYDSLPCGLIFLEGENDEWELDGVIATTALEEVLAPTQMGTVEMKVVIERCDEPAYNNYYNVAEISDFSDENGDEPEYDDIDSTPDDDPNNDEDPINDEILDPMDEDDHDYEDIAICDVALINTIAELETPPSVGDTVKYEVIVENQGNHDVNSVTIDYDIPNGFSYLPVNGTLTPEWTSGSDDDADITTDQVLAPGERDTVCLYLQLENVATDEVTEDSWTTIAEITEYTNQDDEVKTTDADSTPDDDPTNDPGGNPDDDTDDETEGDGTGDPEDPTEDMDPDLDEDDHDPAIVYICDVATIIYHDVPDDINYYDTLKFNVVVFNQGNGEITNVNLVDHLPEGLEYIETASNLAEGWEESEDIDEALELLYEEVIGVGESDTICLELQIVPINDASDEEGWLQVVEVESFEDPANPGDPKSDIDSTPDDDPDNDPGGNPDDETDDETDGEGTGDPEDEMEDMDPDQDEDDHDPVDVKVLDLALIMQIDSMPPVLPVVPGDVLKFIVVVTNQGNTPVNEIEITNYLMDNNLELADVPGNDDWTAVDSETNETVIPGESLPGDVDTICIYMEVLGGAMSDIVTYSEISGSVETDSGDCYDIDSTPDDSNENDEGGSPLTPEDDHIEDDGEDGNEDGITDEDDHDPAMLDVQDLALIVWADHKDPVQEGDDVKFTIRVINQGNVLNENIELVDYIPSGFALSVNDTNNWTADTLDDKKVYTTLAGSLAMGDTIETCIVLTVQEGVSAEDLINYAEIVSSTGPDGLDLNSLDVDSTPNDEQEDDTGGQYEDMPDCSTEPVVINDDNYIEGAGVIEEDEDDHDPAWVHVFDLASIIYTDQTLPVIPGDEVKFVVELYNQGNMSAEDIDLLVHIPDGFTLSANDDNDWEEEGENVVLTYEEVIIPEDSSSVCLLLEVLPDETLGGLIPVLEITGAMDTLGNDQSNNDLDSNPDENASDDEGGEIFTDSDDELEGNGEAGDDEDDHDPAVPPVLDLAITIVPESEEPLMPGDTAKFVITLKNQGSIVPSEFTIEEYIPEGLMFCNGAINAGWTPQGDTSATYTYTDQLLPLTEDTLCIYLKVTEEANPQNVVTMVEYIEVIDMEDRDVSLLDIDSEADNSNENDLGNDLYSVHNDKCDENGRSGGDEDDHDQAWVNMCGPMACKGSINFSLDESCEGSITAAMVLTGDIFPEHIYEITVKDSNGNPVPNEFGIGDVDQTYEVTVTNILCDNISCWLEVTVEYKFDPKIECVANDTLSCVQAFSEASEPTVSANCVSTELLLIDQEIESLDCDTMFTSRMERKYIARDVYGNTSDTCTQVIYLERTNLDSISPVQPFAIYNDKALDCGSGYATTSQGYPYPALSVTGAPRLRVEGGAFVDLYPFESNVICNGYAEFRDELLPGSNSCVTKIMRTFTIGEWWCGSTNERKYVQLIEVVDFTGPEITCPSDMTVSTATLECASMSSFTLPTASDLCNEDIRIDLSTPAGFIANYGGEQVELPVGVHELTYNAYDGCDNLTTCSFTVTVQDNADPIAICDQFTEVGISLDTVTYIYAESIDDGSFDECGEVTLGIARMDSPGFDDLTGFGPKVNVYCDDAGTTVMVGLLVTDAGGNTNMCMVSVDVKDKVDAKMVCPGSMTVECNFAYDEDNLSAFFGEVTIYDNCPSSNTIAEELVGELNSCGSGVLTRQIRLLDAQGDHVDYCEQTITFESGTPLLYSDITPPPSTVTVDGCGVESLDPNILGLPVVPSGICQQTGIAVENDTFPFAEEGACLKIIRTFSVIDWCIESGPGSIADPYKFTQIIKVDNTIAPTITNVFSDSTYCSYATDCGGTDITGLTASSSDDCTAIDDVDRRWEVYDAEDELVRSGLGHDASGYYDLGSYKVRFIAEDGCGNQTVRESSFTVMSCKQPVAYCLDGLSTTLTAMDTDGDGTADAEQVMLTPSYFDAGSYHPCGLDVVLSFSSDLDDTLATFFCSDTTGVVEVELWVTAVDEEGNPLPEMQSYCVAALDVQNNEDIDLCNGLRPSVQGRIYTSADAEVEEVKVELRSSELLIAMTDEAGAYGFMEMPMGGSYELAPGKDDDVLNGVTTLDLVMIQRHLLGIETFDAVDKYIAADINRDDRLTASDLLALRKVILGIETNFPNNTSWRFIDESHEYEDESNPWTETLPETYEIGSLSEDMWIDFVGIKVGDINGNVEANIAAGVELETRSSESLVLILPDTEIVGDDVYEIEVLSKESLNLQGLQLALSLDDIELIDIKPGVLNVRSTDFIETDNGLKLSYANGLGKYIESEDVLFTIVLRSKSSGLLSERIEISERTLDAESYIGKDLKVGSVEIEWQESQTIDPTGFLIGGSVSPNPWRSQTEIRFELPKEGEVKLILRDGSGRVLYSKKEDFGIGKNSFTITDSEVKTTGIILYEIQFEDQIIHKKMIRIE